MYMFPNMFMPEKAQSTIKFYEVINIYFTSHTSIHEANSHYLISFQTITDLDYANNLCSFIYAEKLLTNV